MVKTYSVSEIAERIGRPGEDMRVVGDRIRNWTREGLLDPVGMKNPGTGRSRLYPETALFDALVLTVITEAVGLQVVKVHLFRDIFAKARQYLADPRYSKKTFLVISRHMTFGGYSTQFADPAGLASLLKTSDAEGHIIIDLSKITKKLNP